MAELATYRTFGKVHSKDSFMAKRRIGGAVHDPGANLFHGHYPELGPRSSPALRAKEPF
jgi:hypothetical protein